MIQLLRSFFGLNGTSSNRKVIGSSVSFDMQEVAYIKDSNNRLAVLLSLYKKYKNTSHADKLKAVYDKTRKVHDYLVSQKRVHELELFHIQHTENFISTFSLIIEVYQRHKESNNIRPEIEHEPEVVPVEKQKAADVVREIEIKEPPLQVPLPKVEANHTNHNNKGELFEIAEKARQRNKQASGGETTVIGADMPRLAAPEVSIDTIAKAFYFRLDVSGKQIPYEISFISTPQEKEAFQAHTSYHLGVKNIYYVGNARITKPDSRTPHKEEIVPIIYWSKYSYALTLHDYRLFPVKINRTSV